MCVSYPVPLPPRCRCASGQNVLDVTLLCLHLTPAFSPSPSDLTKGFNLNTGRVIFNHV